MMLFNQLSLAGLLLAALLVAKAPAAHGQRIAETRLTEALKSPYKILTAGNQVTVKSSKDIRTVMAWTPGGTRILEKTILAPLCSFRVPGSHKMVFLRIELTDGKTYSEKIGLN